MYGGLAFVLRVCPNKNKIILLDRKNGKIELYKKNRLTIYNGLLVNCHDNGKQAVIAECLPSGVKFNQVQLSFYHLILEICLNFIPLGMLCPEIFDLIYFIYFSFHLLETSISKKILIYKMFCLLGLGPDSCKYKHLSKLLFIPIDIIVMHHIDLEFEKELNIFIKESLDLYPSIYKFKTKFFLKEIGVL